MRGTDPEHHIHVTELGQARFVGLAFEAASEADLEKLSRLPGASPVEAIDEPGGGRRVRLADPHGHQIEVVHGIARLDRCRCDAMSSIQGATACAARVS